MRIAVTGGRDYTPDEHEIAHFVERWKSLGGTILFEGGATGVDQWAHDWAIRNDVPCATISVNTRIDGQWPGAGPRRSGRMLRDAIIEHLFVFSGGSGTKRCERRALASHIGVTYIRSGAS